MQYNQELFCYRGDLCLLESSLRTYSRFYQLSQALGYAHCYHMVTITRDVWCYCAQLVAFTNENYVLWSLDGGIVQEKVSESFRILSCCLYLLPKVSSEYLEDKGSLYFL